MTKTKTKTRTKVAVAVAGAAVAAAGVLAVTFRPPVIQISIAPDSPDASIVVAEDVDVHLATFNFRAKKHDFIVQTLELTNCLTVAPDVDGDCADPGEEFGPDQIFEEIEIFYDDQNGNQLAHQGYINNGSVIFTGADFYLPAGQEVELEVFGRVGEIDEANVYSGDWGRVNVNTVVGADFLAINQDNGHQIGQARVNQYVLSKPFQIRNTKPTVNLSAGSPAGASIPGYNEVFRFNVSADSNEMVMLNEIVFELNATDGAGSDWNLCDADGSDNGLQPLYFSLYDVSDFGTQLDVDVDWTMLANDLTVCTEDTDVVRYLLLDFSDQLEIAAGMTETYSLYIDTIGASAAHDDSIRVDIPRDGEVQDNGGVDPDGSLLWQDGHASDINAWSIDSLPVSGGTIIY